MELPFLTSAENTLYKILIEYGPQKSGFIIQKSGFVSSRVYTLLNKMLGDGLISYSVINNIKIYEALPPFALLSKVEETKQTLSDITEQIISREENNRSERNFINTYIGTAGFTTAFDKLVAPLTKKDDLRAIAYASDFIVPQMDNLFANLDKKVFEKGAGVKLLMSKRGNGLIKKSRTTYKRYHVKTISEKYLGPMAIDITNHAVILSLWGAVPTAIYIDHPQVVDNFNKYFNFMWEQV